MCLTVITDFGIPKVIGGTFSVMATEIYNQVSGQQNFTMGATVSVVLLVPALVAFFVDRLIQRRNYSLHVVQALRRRTAWSLMLAYYRAGVIAGIYLVILVSSPSLAYTSARRSHYPFRHRGGTRRCSASTWPR